MKKCVALVIACAFLMSAVACKKAGSEKETTESASESSETVTSSETEETGSSSSETTEPTTSQTTAPTETTRKGDPNWKPTPMESMSIDTSHKNLDISSDFVTGKYVVNDPDTDDEVACITCRYQTFTVKDKGFEDLQKTLDEILMGDGERLEKLYDQKVTELKKSLPSADEPMFENYHNHIYLGRADDQIVSFELRSWDDSYSEKCYNIDSKTGKIISFDDVVKDKDALCEYIESAIYKEDYPSEYYVNHLEEMIPKIKDGTVDFRFTFDGIIVETFYVSAVNCPDCFNMDYFFSVPGSYIITEDISNTISWDIDGDGKVEMISMGSDSDGRYVNIGGVKTNVRSNSDYRIHLAHTSTGFYMNFGVLCGSDDRCEVIYHINNDKTVEYVTEGCLTDMGNDYDPESMVLETEDQHYNIRFFGIKEPCTYYSFTGDPIEVKPRDTMFGEPYGPYHMKVDVEGKVKNDDGTWKNCTLKTDAKVLVIGYDSSTKELIISDAYSDESKNKTYRIPYDASKGQINGEFAFSVFDGMAYGG